MRAIPIIDRYISRMFLNSLIMATAAFLVIFLVVDVVENIDKFIDAHARLPIAIAYYFYNLPFFLSLSLPIAMLLASVLAFGGLARHNELGALLSSGVSLYRLALPVLIIGAAISLLAFAFGETVVIEAVRARNAVAQEHLKTKTRRSSIRENIFFQDAEDRSVAIASYDLATGIAHRVSIIHYQGNRVTKRIDAESMRWEPEARRWTLETVVLRKFTGDNEGISKAALIDTVRLQVTPDILKKNPRKPEEMSYWELADFVRTLRHNNMDTRRWDVNLHFKLAFAFTNFIVVLFGVPLAAPKRHGGVAFGVGMGLFVTFAYYGLIKFGQTLGLRYLLPPIPAVWLGNAVFLCLGLLFLWKVRK